MAAISLGAAGLGATDITSGAAHQRGTRVVTASTIDPQQSPRG